MNIEEKITNRQTNVLLFNSMNMDLLKAQFGFMLSHGIRSYSSRIKGLLFIYNKENCEEEREKILDLMVESIHGLDEELLKIKQQLNL